jgi:hypothetical protein
MTEERGIQITRGAKQVNKVSPQNGIEISHSGRPIAGTVPEMVEVPFRCASTGKGFKVLLEKKQTTQSSRYRVISILKEGETGRQGEAVSSPTLKKLDIDINKIDRIHNIKCPYCGGGKYALLQCGCGGLACGGGVRHEGNRQYQECPWCHSVGVIRGEIEKLSGERSTSHRGLPRSSSSQQQLKTSTDTAPKLPPGQKQMTKQ